MVLICIFLMVAGVEHCHRLNSLGSRLIGRLVSSRFFQGEHLGSTSAQEKRQKHYWTREEIELLYNGVSEALADLTKSAENALKKKYKYSEFRQVAGLLCPPINGHCDPGQVSALQHRQSLKWID